MSGNSFGTIFRITTFGESHGKAIGVIIDGCPAGLNISLAEIQKELDRRRPGQSSITSPRNEADQFEILSGIYQNKTLGTPISLLVQNKDQKPEDYTSLATIYRPSHADYTWEKKFGIRDPRGGGRASARETLARVAAGAIAKQLLAQYKISIQAYVSAVGKVINPIPYSDLDLNNTENSIIRNPDAESATKMIEAINLAREQGDSLGGVITCIIKNCPPGLGEPVFDKLHADLGKAMLSINAVKGFEIGEGFQAGSMLGSEHNDPFEMKNNKVGTTTNHSGGIQGGISNGEDIYFRIAFKPVATIAQKQNSIDNAGNAVSLEAKGRHDPCVVPRAVPIVEAMAALVLADHLLRAATNKI